MDGTSGLDVERYGDRSVWRTVGSPLVAGAPGGPLSGETVAVKDLFPVEGFRLGGGVPAYYEESAVSTVTSPAVTALLDAGADVIGIAQTDEFAYSIAGRNPHYGTPPNPAVVGGIPGGSSSGPASAVALGEASIGLGTDTGGSIRVPASYQGLWGLRTTHGSVSADGLLPLAPSFDTIGWLTRDAAVLRRAAAATLDPSLQIAATSFVVAPALLSYVEDDVRAAFSSFVDPAYNTVFVDPSYDTVDLGDIDELFLTFRTVQQAEAWRTHGEWITAHPGALGTDIAERFEFASRVTAAEESTARKKRAALRARLDEVLGGRVLLVPAASSRALSVTADAAAIERTRQGTLRLTCIAGLTGRPALSVPVLRVPALSVPMQSGLIPAPPLSVPILSGPIPAPQPSASAGAPVGLCLVGPRYSDLALIALGEQLAG